MSKESILAKKLASFFSRNFVKGLAIGIGAAIVLGTIVGVSVYYGVIYEPNTNPNPNPEPGTPFSSRLAEEVFSIFPNVVHVAVLGNGTAAINENMLSASFDRVEEGEDYIWSVLAYTFGGPVEFNLTYNEVGQIAQGLFDSINNTEKVGTYGEGDYPAEGELPNLKWVTEIYLENNTLIYLYVNMGGLILYQRTTWDGNFNSVNANMIGSAVLLPESAFDDYIQVLRDLFDPHV